MPSGGGVPKKEPVKAAPAARQTTLCLDTIRLDRLPLYDICQHHELCFADGVSNAPGCPARPNFLASEPAIYIVTSELSTEPRTKRCLSMALVACRCINQAICFSLTRPGLTVQSLENACRHAVDEASHAAEAARRDAQSFKEKWEYCAHKLHQNDVQASSCLGLDAV